IERELSPGLRAASGKIAHRSIEPDEPSKELWRQPDGFQKVSLQSASRNAEIIRQRVDPKDATGSAKETDGVIRECRVQGPRTPEVEECVAQPLERSLGRSIENSLFELAPGAAQEIDQKRHALPDHRGRGPE